LTSFFILVSVAQDSFSRIYNIRKIGPEYKDFFRKIMVAAKKTPKLFASLQYGLYIWAVFKKGEQS